MIVSKEVVDSVPMSRNRWLAWAGSSLVALAATAWFPQQAFADNPPPYCHGAGQCACCNGSTCCEFCCFSGYYGCESGTQCWYTCAYYGSQLVKIICCDWGARCHTSVCICSTTVGPC